MRRATRRYAIAAVATAAACAATLASPAPAVANPVIQPFSCESGASRYICNISVSGASGPVQIRWTISGASAPAFDNSSFISGGCAAGQRFPVQVVVTDAVGATSGSRTVVCSSGPWP